MRYFYFQKNILPVNTRVECVAEKVSENVRQLWFSASIPCVEINAIKRRILRKYDKVRLVRKETRSNKNKQALISKGKKLFDIACCQCKDFDQCTCKRSFRVPVNEREFLTDQRNERMMFIGTMDAKDTTKNFKRIDRKQKHENYLCKRQKIDYSYSCSEDENN